MKKAIAIALIAALLFLTFATIATIPSVSAYTIPNYCDEDRGWDAEYQLSPLSWIQQRVCNFYTSR